MPFPHKNIRLHPQRYIGQSSYFVTLCCAGRRPVFATSKNAVWLIEILRKHSISHRFAVHAYCVMPDHFHVLVAGLDPSSSLLAFIKNLKQTTSREFQKQFRKTLWQKKFYDHILRPRDNPDGVAAYIWSNPVRKGLCKDPRAYPYSGSFTTDWKKTIFPVELWAPDWKAKAPA
ncbi:MAG TPA: transposase [Candidatus Acidoferrales bacterium]|nr:transposase [Candidatus Acidoferrales bacterium]